MIKFAGRLRFSESAPSGSFRQSLEEIQHLISPYWNLSRRWVVMNGIGLSVKDEIHLINHNDNVN